MLIRLKFIFNQGLTLANADISDWKVLVMIFRILLTCLILFAAIYVLGMLKWFLSTIINMTFQFYGEELQPAIIIVSTEKERVIRGSDKHMPQYGKLKNNEYLLPIVPVHRL